MNRTYVPRVPIGRCDYATARQPARRTPRAVYHRRRLIAILLLLVFAGLLPGASFALTAQARAEAVRTARPPLIVVVGQGETLWDLALAYAPPHRDPVAYLAEVIALNDVRATALQPGMVLQLP